VLALAATETIRQAPVGTASGKRDIHDGVGRNAIVEAVGKSRRAESPGWPEVRCCRRHGHVAFVSRTRKGSLVMSEQITKRAALSAGFGAGVVAFSEQRASADTPFSNFAFPVTGGTARRTMPDRLTDIINVKDFGAVGDGIANDTAAIKAAIAAAAIKGTARAGMSRTGGTVYFPAGQYRVTETLFPPNTPSGTTQVNLVGAGKTCCALMGELPNDYLIVTTDWNKWFGLIEGFRLYNARGIYVDSIMSMVIRDCDLRCSVNALAIGGVSGNCYNTSIYNTQCVGAAGSDGVMTPGSVGIQSAQAEFYGVSVTNYDIGFAGWNVGIVFQGGRFEVNNTAVVLGAAPLGGTAQLTGSRFDANSYERNDTAMVMANVYSSQITSQILTGTVAPYFGLDGSGGDFVIQSITWSGSVATITTVNNHGIQNFLAKVRGGAPTCGIAIGGNSVGAYNNSVVATPTGAKTLTFSMGSNPGNGTGGSFRLQLLNGLVVKTAGNCVFASIDASANYSGAAIDLSAPNLGAWGSTFISCNANHNQGAGGVNWRLPSAAIRSSQLITFIPNM
jgi:hypothetical protein